jgi:hypothetical protein
MIKFFGKSGKNRYLKTYLPEQGGQVKAESISSLPLV